MNKELIHKLSLLGYSKDWIEKGMLTEKYLDKQIEEFKREDEESNLVDDFAEHYRNAAFHHFLENRNTITNKEIDTLLSIADTEEDLYKGAITKLLEEEYLTDEQFKKLANYLITRNKLVPKAVIRAQLIRQIKKTPLTTELFETCLQQGDAIVHILLLDLVRNNKEKIKQLADKGANKKIRNIAKQLYQRKS